MGKFIGHELDRIERRTPGKLIHKKSIQFCSKSGHEPEILLENSSNHQF